MGKGPGFNNNLDGATCPCPSSVFSLCSRLELNGIKSIPPRAFSPYRKLRRM